MIDLGGMDLATTGRSSRRPRFTLRPDQERALQFVSGELRAGKEEVLLAACPGFGKTETAIAVIAREVAAGRSVLVLAHATTVLRANFVDRLERRRPELLAHPRLRVAIPQEAHKISGRYDLVIVDEAHEYYEVDDGLVRRLLRKVRARQVLLLTGTPFCFTARGLKGFLISLQELRAAGRASDLRVELATATFPVRLADWNENEELSGSVRFRRSATYETMTGILDTYPTVADGKTSTLIYCRSREMARQVDAFLAGRGCPHLVSYHEDGDDDGSRVEAFRRGEAPVLVVVRRGRLGFDMPGLVNVVDLTMSRNPGVIFQMMCRLVRLPEERKEAPEKVFIKVMPAVFDGDKLRHFMSGVIELATPELYGSWTNGPIFRLPAAFERQAGASEKGEGFKPYLASGMRIFGDYFHGIEEARRDPSCARIGYVKLWEALALRANDPERKKDLVKVFYADHGRLPSRARRRSSTADPEERARGEWLATFCKPSSPMFDPVFRAWCEARGFGPRPARHEPAKRRCSVCRRWFVNFVPPDYRDRKTCSRKCAYEGMARACRREVERATCVVCGKTFLKTCPRVKHVRRKKTCSRDCTRRLLSASVARTWPQRKRRRGNR